MLVHDLRLQGTAPRLAANIYKVDGGTPLSHAIAWIGRYAGTKSGVDQLLIMCHGMSAGVMDTNTNESAVELGLGLQFCKENLSLSNVSLTSVWRGLIGEIVLFACGPARTRPGYRNSIIDGSRFCSELAAFADADVVASSETQWYNMLPPTNLLYAMFKIGPQDTIDFGAWEGDVMRFSPSGRITPVK